MGSNAEQTPAPSINHHNVTRMKYNKPLAMFILLFTPFLLQAQDIVGSWSVTGVTPDGTSITNTITFNTDMTMTVDMGSDGTIDVRAKYSVDGDVVSVSDTGTKSPCYGKVGMYRMSFADDKATATLVKDDCVERKGDGRPMVMTRIK